MWQILFPIPITIYLEHSNQQFDIIYRNASRKWITKCKDNQYRLHENGTSQNNEHTKTVYMPD